MKIKFIHFYKYIFTETLDFLLSEGADVETRDKFGMQAVHVAAWEGALNVLEVMINKFCFKKKITWNLRKRNSLSKDGVAASRVENG